MACVTRLHGNCIERDKKNMWQSNMLRRVRHLSVVPHYLSQTLLPVVIKIPKRIFILWGMNIFFLSSSYHTIATAIIQVGHYPSFNTFRRGWKLIGVPLKRGHFCTRGRSLMLCFWTKLEVLEIQCKFFVWCLHFIYFTSVQRAICQLWYEL